MQHTLTSTEPAQLGLQAQIATDPPQLRAQIARLEAELARYALQYGLTHEARRLLEVRLQNIGRFNL